jgi:hypothetical protein
MDPKDDTLSRAVVDEKGGVEAIQHQARRLFIEFPGSDMA